MAARPPCGTPGVNFGFNLRPRGIQQGFSGSFETLLSISVSIETEVVTAFDEGRGVRALKKKLGLNIVSEKVDDRGRVYRII